MSSSFNAAVNETEANEIRKLPAKLPWVIPVSCEGCGGCVNKCPRGHLKMTETNVQGVFVPWLDDPLKCSGCGRCCSACAMGAISMTSYVDMAMKRFLEKKPEIPIDTEAAS